MKLWTEVEYVNSAGKTVRSERAVKAKVSEMTEEINRQVLSRGTKALNALHSAELRVLKGQRSGRKYRKPYTGSKTSEERKKSGYKPPMYVASASGEAPARRTGNLRLHWNGQVKTGSVSGRRVSIMAELESQEPYAVYLEHGTAHMAARPFAEKIKEEALPEIQKIYSEPYT